MGYPSRMDLTMRRALPHAAGQLALAAIGIFVLLVAVILATVLAGPATAGQVAEPPAPSPLDQARMAAAISGVALVALVGFGLRAFGRRRRRR